MFISKLKNNFYYYPILLKNPLLKFYNTYNNNNEKNYRQQYVNVNNIKLIGFISPYSILAINNSNNKPFIFSPLNYTFYKNSVSNK